MDQTVPTSSCLCARKLDGGDTGSFILAKSERRQNTERPPNGAGRHEIDVVRYFFSKS